MKKALWLGFVCLSLMFTTAVKADAITNLQVLDGSGSPTANITYDNANGIGTSSAYVYADPQVSGGTVSPLFYCVDLWHDNYLGSTYTITEVPSMSFAHSTFTDVDNRLAWLLTQDQSTPDARAAVQLAIWYTVDNPGFSMTSGDATVTADYNALVSFAGYDPGATYAAHFWQATHDPSDTLYQDLISDPPPNAGPMDATVPEPASLVLAAMGIVGMFGLYRWTRRAPRPSVSGA